MVSSPGHDNTRRFRLVFLAPVFGLIALICWALSSPFGSSPDDDYHLISIACGLGDRPGICESVPGEPGKRMVPNADVVGGACYEHKPDKSAACEAGDIGDADRLVETDRGNFAGSYPPVYYAFMGLFVGPDPYVSAIVVRIVNAAVFLLLVSVLYFLLPFRHRQPLVLAWVVTMVPLGMFLVASDNPSAWAVISGGTLWLALVGFFEAGGWRKIALGVVAGVTAVVGAGARADAAVYAVIGCVLAVILTARRQKSYWFTVLLPVGIAIASYLFYRSAQQSTISSTGIGGGTAADHPARSVGDLLQQIVLGVPELWAGVFGAQNWGLGWVDTVMPATVWVLAFLCFAGASFSGIISNSVRKLVALVLLMGALWIIPSWILYQSHVVVGSQVQPRYLLPLIVMLAGIALFQSDRASVRFSHPQLVLLVVGVSVANAIALHTNMRRYITGLDVHSPNLDAGAEWWWNLPFSPMFIWAVGSVAFAAAVVTALWEVSWRAPIVEADAAVRTATGTTIPLETQPQARRRPFPMTR